MCRSTWALVLATALVACGEASVSIPGSGMPDEPMLDDGAAQLEDAITSGRSDPGHPSVGVVRSGYGACTGTLIGRRTVLTAAHCVNGTSATFHLGGLRYTSSRAVRHPGYGGGNDDDVGVLVLSMDVQGVAPSPISRSAPSVGQPITLVGYGLTSEGGSGWGTKRFATNTISSVRSTYFSFGGSGNVCDGDSGGPSFVVVDGEERVAGVHSTKSGACGQGGNDMRVDVYAQWISEIAAGDLGAPQTTTPPSTPSSGAVAEGGSCAQAACGAGLACTPVRNRYGQELGRFCMETCGSAGADPACDGGEVCTQSRTSGLVCFDRYARATGYTNRESSAPTQPPPTTPTQPPTQPPSSSACAMNAEESAVFELLNAERQRQGLRALTCDAKAGLAARGHSQDMCDNEYQSHTSLDGRSPGDRLREAGATFSGWGENIAWGYGTARSVHDGWMSSSGHRGNMLSSSWTRVGVGFVSCSGGRYPTYWTQNFLR